MTPDVMAAATVAVRADRIALTAAGEPGPNGVIGTLLLRVLRVAALALGHDGEAASAACCEHFARFAVHGGYASDRGFTWNRPIIHVLGARSMPGLLAAASAEGALVALFTQPDDGGGIDLRLYEADGTPITEANGLDELRARLATGRPALPFNSEAVGIIIDRQKEYQ
jgi:hypothetical protein